MQTRTTKRVVAYYLERATRDFIAKQAKRDGISAGAVLDALVDREARRQKRRRAA